MLALALENLKSKQISSYQAEKLYGIPRRTLLDKLNGKHSKSVGCPTKLEAAVEDKIVNCLITTAEFGSPLTLLELRMLVYKYLEKNNYVDIFFSFCTANLNFTI